MTYTLNTNTASGHVQRHLAASQGALQAAVQRLSSGLRVNSAKDDAAGYAIASRMDSLIRGQSVAVRNVNDAISFSQTKESALSQIGEHLQRMRDLALASSNGTHGLADKGSLQVEFRQLQDDITRITTHARFNGQQVLGAVGASMAIQVGAGAHEQIHLTSENLTSAASDTYLAAHHASDFAWDTKVSIENTLNTFAQQGAKISYSPETGEATVDISAMTSAFIASAVVSIKDSFNSINTTCNNWGLNIGNAQSAQSAVDQIDSALKEVNQELALQGANQNRFAAVIATLNVSLESQTQAHSRIMDTDFASETTTLTRQQVLQQAGTALLAQANQLPKGILGLLQ